MYYVYFLKSIKDGKLYIGSTPDLKKRFRQHQQGQSKATKSRRPFKLIYYEAYSHKDDAKAREKFYKTGWGKNHMNKHLPKTLLS
ncbi:TPA: hypothetical protein DCG61_01835 [Patescibacteria group bacterium]|jgi:putative endonuclease|nr:hypothetical protein [Patescibacteria group bacterium]